MSTVVGVRLRFSKTLWFDPAGTTPAEGDTVIVETERGREVGTVVQAPHQVSEVDLAAPLKPVVRVADEDDLNQVDENTAKEREALGVFRELVAEHKLDMKPIDVEYLLDGDKVVFYFSAEERVDFRELVKDLAARYHARIDMRQVGVRDEARRVGGVGHCGQMLCCVRFGGEFQPVSIRMAKEQDLPLNPLKISGLCGRLMCCLRYEFDAYKDFKSRAPKRGAMVETPTGGAKVVDLNTPKETVTMRLGDGTSVTVPLSSMQCAKGGGCPCSVSREALDEAQGTGPIDVAMLGPAPKLEESPREVPSEAPQPAAPSDGVRRRRRRSRSSQGEAGKDVAATGGQPKPPQPKAKPKGGQQKAAEPKPPQEATGGDKPSGGRRRRRRRRPNGGGGGQEG